MAKRFSLHDDAFIVQYFDVVGELIDNDLSQSWPSIKKRAELLKDSGVWQSIEMHFKFEWASLRDRALLYPTQELVILDMCHPGSMIDSSLFNNFLSSKEYAADTAERFRWCKIRMASSAVQQTKTLEVVK